MSQAIGIFDSGLGGLTVFRALQDVLPEESLVYLGDTARVPYGTKSAVTVIEYSRENTRFLLEHQVKLVVVACNTASAYAVETLRREFSIPIIGVLEPGAAHAATETHRRKIGVIGTAGTIASGAYPDALHRINPTLEIFSQACPLLVPLVEEGWLDREETYSIARTYLNPLIAAEIDTLILACTHYPLLKPVLQAVIGPQVTLIDSATATAEAVRQLLEEKKLLIDRRGARTISTNSQHKFYVTDSPDRFRRIGEIFLGHKLDDVIKV